MTIEAGARLGPYEIEEAIGAGGMGEVYRARDTRLDRSVAIKVLPAHLAENPELRQRLEREGFPRAYVRVVAGARSGEPRCRLVGIFDPVSRPGCCPGVIACGAALTSSRGYNDQ